MKKTAFTLIEILIVVILLGILAAIVVPQFTEASDEAEDAKIASDLKILKGQIQLYRAKEGAFPTALSDLSPTYIETVPTKPDGTAYTYTAATGTVEE
jgi:general secretion pathway protein G